MSTESTLINEQNLVEIKKKVLLVWLDILFECKIIIVIH